MIESSKIKLPLKNVSAATKLLESMHLDVKKARQTVFDRLNRSNDLEELVFLLKEDNNAKKLEIETLKNDLNQIEDRQEIRASSVKFESMETIRLIENEKNKLRETNMIYENLKSSLQLRAEKAEILNAELYKRIDLLEHQKKLISKDLIDEKGKTEILQVQLNEEKIFNQTLETNRIEMLEKIKNLEATISRMNQDFDLEQDRLIEEITNQILQKNISHKAHFTLHQETPGNLSANSSPNRYTSQAESSYLHPVSLSPANNLKILSPPDTMSRRLEKITSDVSNMTLPRSPRESRESREITFQIQQGPIITGGVGVDSDFMYSLSPKSRQIYNDTLTLHNIAGLNNVNSNSNSHNNMNMNMNNNNKKNEFEKSVADYDDDYDDESDRMAAYELNEDYEGNYYTNDDEIASSSKDGEEDGEDGSSGTQSQNSYYAINEMGETEVINSKDLNFL